VSSGRGTKNTLAFSLVRRGKNKQSSINLLNDARRKRRRDRWLIGVLMLASLFVLGYAFVEVKQGEIRSVILPTTPPEKPSQPQAAVSPAGSSEKPREGTNVYAATTERQVADRFAGIPERVYVPNVADGTVDVIDPDTFEVVDHYAVGEIPHHVTPSWDMNKLYVSNEASSSLTVIDPKSGEPSGTVLVPYPYNLYFTPDGKKAIVVVERLQMLEFYDPGTWQPLGSVYIPSPGVDHIDFSAGGDYLLASSEWGGVVTKVDTTKMKITGSVEVGGNPVDVKLSPDGKVFYVANQNERFGGVHVIDPKTMRQLKFIPTGAGAHGLYLSRDAKSLYVANRLAGTISVIDFASRKVRETWEVGGSPDMFQLSPDGTQLWYADRYNSTVSVVDTRSGKLIERIGVGYYPHGLTYFPNVGRFSLGHNGVYR
jgi:YVTN family beta-propeller protein